MTPFSDVLIYKLNELQMGFKALAHRLPEAGELLESAGRPVPQDLLRELANSSDQFERLKREVLRLSESVAGVPQPPELGSISDLRSFMDSVSEVIEKQSAHRTTHQAACGVLEGVITITHVDGIEFAPLVQCQERARKLRDSIAETTWPNIHPEADALTRGQHIFSEFVKLVSLHDQLEDEEWGRLQELVNHSLGKPLGLAASRGKLALSTSAPPVPQAAVPVAQPAAAPEQKEETGATEKVVVDAAPPAPSENHGEGLPAAESSAPIDAPPAPPSPMPNGTAEAVAEPAKLEASGELAPEPVSQADPEEPASTDQPGDAPAPELPAIVTTATTFEATLDDIRYMLVLDLIDSKGMAKALSNKITAASSAAAGGDTERAENHLKAFITEVNAQTGKHISGAAPQLLLKDANTLLGQLQ
jgi:hypothetical protein